MEDNSVRDEYLIHSAAFFLLFAIYFHLNEIILIETESIELNY